MDELSIKHGPFIVVRRILGVINLICAIAWLLSRMGSLRVFDWIFFITFMISGGSLLTNGFGTEKSFLRTGDGFLKIKWINRFSAKIFDEKEIEKITLTRFKVIIVSKEKKPSDFTLDFLEKEQKKEVYDFFIEYAKKRDLELVRDF